MMDPAAERAESSCVLQAGLGGRLGALGAALLLGSSARRGDLGSVVPGDHS